MKRKVSSATRKAFGLKIKSLREKSGRTQNMLAEEIGIAVPYLGNIEIGRVTPSLAMVEAFAKLFGVSIADLFAKIPANTPIRKGQSPLRRLVNLLQDAPESYQRIVLENTKSLMKNIQPKAKSRPYKRPKK